MIKAILQHQGGSVDLFEGEVTIGRGLQCPIRFNDHSVSRQHVKLLITANGVTVRDLGSRNGTRINHQPLRGTAPLRDRDILQIGKVQLRLVMLTAAASFMDETVTSPDAALPRETDPALRLLSGAAWDAGDEAPAQPRAKPKAQASAASEREALAHAQLETEPVQPMAARKRRPSQSDVQRATPAPERTPIILMRDSTELPLPDLISRTCPDCRTQVPVPQEQCHQCGYKWRLRGPLSKTQPIVISSLSDLGLDQELHDRAMERRAADRVSVEVPVLYHSENLSFDARAQNVSRTGVFVASDLLDAVGTPCTLRVLPDGHPAVSIGGVVKHVVTSTNAEKDQVPGMGIRFQRMSRGALTWLWAVLGEPPAE
jgi:pSer/pThr/pTyr-binding forkhead associated (FHA) protein